MINTNKLFSQAIKALVITIAIGVLALGYAYLKARVILAPTPEEVQTEFVLAAPDNNGHIGDTNER